MERRSADKVHGGPRARRASARTQSMAHRRNARGSGERYETPAWLDHSFVLPVHQSVDTLADEAMPVQERPTHDDLVTAGDPLVSTSAAADFVRPPSAEIDFVRVVRLAEASRRARRAAAYAVILALLAIAIFMVTWSPAMLSVAGLSIAGGVAAAVLALRLKRRPIPRVRG